MNKIKIQSRKTGKEQTVDQATLTAMQDLNGKQAFKVLKADTTPPEALATPTKKSEPKQ
jgi:hypothetical protein